MHSVDRLSSAIGGDDAGCIAETCYENMNGVQPVSDYNIVKYSKVQYNNTTDTVMVMALSQRRIEGKQRTRVCT